MVIADCVSTEHTVSAAPFGQRSEHGAHELYQTKVVPGRDYALTEIVHCKSLAEIGVANAADECAGRYPLSVIEASAAVVIVTLGKFAETYLRRLLTFEGNMSSPVFVAGRERVVAVLPHPNARKRRSFQHCFTEAEVTTLRDRLRKAGI